METVVTALVSWPSAPLTESLVRRSLQALKPPPEIVASLPPSFSSLLQWSGYDSMNHELTHSDHRKVLASSYTIRKALIRKHFLSRCVHSYITKNVQTILKDSIPRTWDLEISYADELDEMWSDELWDLGEALQDTSKWYILKPGMADRGMGIRLFNSKEILQQIFDEFDEGSEDEEAEEGDDEEAEEGVTSVVTSQLRHFVVQEYISTPVLMDPRQVQFDNSPPKSTSNALEGHKFHLRAYVVASGALSIYLYPQILALFSAVPYVTPVLPEFDGTESHISSVDLAPHLTNTSLQTHRGEEGVRLLDELIGCSILSSDESGKGPDGYLTLTSGDVAAIKDQVAGVLAETFKAALEMPVHFQPLPNAFELYGVDFLLSHSATSSHQDSHKSLHLQVQLLEINSEPAIELTGPRLTWILEDLFVAIGKACITPYFSQTPNESRGDQSEADNWKIGETRHGLTKCFRANVRGR